MTDEVEVPTGVAVLGMVGAWAEDTERHLTAKLDSGRGGVTLSREEADNVVEALKQVQESVVVVLNGDAPLHPDQEAGEAYIDPSDLMQANSGTDHMYWRFYEHLNKHLVEGKSKRLSLSLTDVRGYLNILDATKKVLSALERSDDSPGPNGGCVLDNVGTIEGNVIYPDVWHRRAA
jgi:hypothetical protein